MKKNNKQTQPPPLPSRHFDSGTQTILVAIAYTSAVYETPKPRFNFGEINDDDDEDDVDEDNVSYVKGDARAYGRETFGPIASPYILPYFYKRRRHLETRYDIRKEGDSFKIGDSAVLVDTDSDITIRGKEFRGITGLWELLTRKSVDRRKITTDDLKKCKKIWSRLTLI